HNSAKSPPAGVFRPAGPLSSQPCRGRLPPYHTRWLLSRPVCPVWECGSYDKSSPARPAGHNGGLTTRHRVASPPAIHQPVILPSAAHDPAARRTPVPPHPLVRAAPPPPPLAAPPGR